MRAMTEIVKLLCYGEQLPGGIKQWSSAILDGNF